MQLREPGWQAVLMTAAYYSVLNDDVDFGRGLAELYQKLGAVGDREATADENDLIQPFANHWPLSQAYALNDLWFSAFETWEPSILRATRPKLPPDDPIAFLDDFSEARLIWLGAERARLSVNLQARGLTLEGGGWSNIFPPKPEPDQNYYHPALVSRHEIDRWADTVADQIRQSILDQADEIDRHAKASGMRRLPPRLHNREHLLLMARRLYRRSVLGQSWSMIARLEPPRRSAQSTAGGEDAQFESARKAVIGSVRRWASQLGVRLPRDLNGLG